MLGKTPRGVTEKLKETRQGIKPYLIWAWLLVFLLLAILFIIAVFIWRPWRPVPQQQVTDSIQQTAASQDLNQDYRFYDVLPQQKVAPIPEQAVPEVKQTAQPPVVEPTAPITIDESVDDPFDESQTPVRAAIEPMYILQIQSFSDADHADAKRAEVLLNGISADVVMSNTGNKVWYRVVSGPYHSEQAAKLAQQTLRNGGIDAIIVKKQD